MDRPPSLLGRLFVRRAAAPPEPEAPEPEAPEPEAPEPEAAGPGAAFARPAALAPILPPPWSDAPDPEAAPAAAALAPADDPRPLAAAPDAAPADMEAEAALIAAQAAWDAKPGQREAALAVVRALAALDRGPAILRWTVELQASHPHLVDRVLRAAVRQLPKDMPLGLAYCRSAERRDDVREAAARWWDLRKRLPRRVMAHSGYIDCMLAQGQPDEAERAARSALEFLGKLPPLLEAHARIAEAGGHWAQAVSRWSALLAAAPTHPTAAVRRDAAEAQAQTAPPPPPAERPPRIGPIDALTQEALAAHHALLMNFESLGRNCEFGLLQRMFKAEPVSLTRFSTMRPRTLLQLLDTRFAGIGDPACNEVLLVQKEYRLRHTPTGWRTHTRVMGDQAEPAQVLASQCRHTNYLREKLLDDLDCAAKIFVYQQVDLTDDTIAAIYAALQQFGDNMLMCVRLATAEHKVGAIDWPEERLMVAHIDVQGQEFTGAGWDISVDYWLHFCAVAQARRSLLATQDGA